MKMRAHSVATGTYSVRICGPLSTASAVTVAGMALASDSAEPTGDLSIGDSPLAQPDGQTPDAQEPEAGQSASDPNGDASRQVIYREHTLFEGPLPPPELLAQYNALITDGANRIFAVFESQVQHRLAMEGAEQALDKAESDRDTAQ